MESHVRLTENIKDPLTHTQKTAAVETEEDKKTVLTFFSIKTLQLFFEIIDLHWDSGYTELFGSFHRNNIHLN